MFCMCVGMQAFELNMSMHSPLMLSEDTADTSAQSPLVLVIGRLYDGHQLQLPHRIAQVA